MYRSSSPVFDASELSALRRVKPLPKRRRTSTSSDDPASETSSNDIIPPLIEHLESLKAKIAIGASVDELRPHAESLTAYLPAGAAGVEEKLLRQLEETDARFKETLSVMMSMETGTMWTICSSPEIRRRGRRGKLSAATVAGLKHKELLKSRKRQLAAVLAAERLAATKEEVALLRKRFEAELAKQALKAAKMAATERRKASPNSKSARSKNSERAQRGPRTLNAPPPSQQANDKGSDHDSLGSGGKFRKSKKKKRPQVAQNNFLSPPPLRFLAADIPPRRRNKENASVPSVNATDEWICALCEYKLFYGDEHEYRTAIKNRKKVLKRRRRARERAAAAASGKIKAKAPEKTTLPEEEYAEFDPSMPEEFSNSLNPGAFVEGDPNKQVERAERQIHSARLKKFAPIRTIHVSFVVRSGFSVVALDADLLRPAQRLNSGK
ncbi:Glycosyltransferase family protein [Salix suchowensis]|nr:Glycosyltransferase family protein [Salix suchowensis]